jgi:putative NADPH-quinone reductase
MDEVLLIAGSPRADGNTAAIVNFLREGLELADRQVVELRLCRIDPFEYDADMHRDDFHSVLDQMLHRQHIVFLTPVYWYAMSGLMKTLFDRFTDLLSAESRPLGRALAGRHVWLLANGTDAELPPGFAVPFEMTAAYFAMKWEQVFYMRIDGAGTPAEQDFTKARDLAAALQRTCRL